MCVHEGEEGVSVCVQACKYGCVRVCVCFLPVQHADKNKEPQTLSCLPVRLSILSIQGETP